MPSARRCSTTRRASSRRSAPSASRRSTQPSAIPVPACSSTSSSLRRAGSSSRCHPSSHGTSATCADDDTGTSSAGPCRAPSSTARAVRTASGHGLDGARPAALHDEVDDERHDRDGHGVVDVVQVVLPVLPVVADLLADEPRARTPTAGSPATVKSVKRQNGIRATPAGSETKVRTIGSIRAKKTVASPWRSNQRSARREMARLDVQLAAVLLEHVDAAVVPDRVGDPGPAEVPERADDA